MIHVKQYFSTEKYCDYINYDWLIDEYYDIVFKTIIKKLIL